MIPQEYREAYRSAQDLIEAYVTALGRWDGSLAEVARLEKGQAEDPRRWRGWSIHQMRAHTQQKEAEYRRVEQQMAVLIEYNGPIERYGQIFTLTDDLDETVRRVVVLRVTDQYKAQLPESLQLVPGSPPFEPAHAATG